MHTESESLTQPESPPAKLRNDRVIQKNDQEGFIALPMPIPSPASSAHSISLPEPDPKSSGLDTPSGASVVPKIVPTGIQQVFMKKTNGRNGSIALPMPISSPEPAAPAASPSATPPGGPQQVDETGHEKRNYYWHTEPPVEIRWSVAKQYYVFATNAPQTSETLLDAPDDGTGLCQCQTCKTGRREKGVPAAFVGNPPTRHDGLRIRPTFAIVDNAGNRGEPLSSVPLMPPCPCLQQSEEDFRSALDSIMGGPGMERTGNFLLGDLRVQRTDTFGIGKPPMGYGHQLVRHYQSHLQQHFSSW